MAIKTLIDGTPPEDIVQELRKQSPTLARLNDDFRYLHSDLEILTIFELEDTPSVFETLDVNGGTTTSVARFCILLLNGAARRQYNYFCRLEAE